MKKFCSSVCAWLCCVPNLDPALIPHRPYQFRSSVFSAVPPATFKMFDSDSDFGDMELPRKRQLETPNLDQQLQRQHQQMMENLQAQHREFMDSAWRAQMQYLTFCQETGIAAAPLPARPPTQPHFNQAAGGRPQQQYGQGRPQVPWKNQGGPQQWQSWQQRNARRPPPPQRANQQEPPMPRSTTKSHRSVAVWVNHETGQEPSLYCSVKPWKSQLRGRTTMPEHDVPIMFRGRTLTALRLREPEPLQPWAPVECPEPRVCDVCGGTVLNEVVHNKSTLHREYEEMDVELICSRIRRDPAFAAAVIGAARECVESTGLVEPAGDEDNYEDEEEEEVEGVGGNCVGEDDEEDVKQPPVKQQRVESQPPPDAFGLLEGEVFRREVGKKRKMN